MPPQPEAQPKPIKGKIAAGTGVAALIALAVQLALPGTRASEGEKYVAYQDSGGVWTICDGHTAGVKRGMTATKADCERMLREDLTSATAEAVAITPQLASGPASVAGQAGDFTLNAGAGWWRKSPMARAAGRLDWRGSCEAFRGYIVSVRSAKPLRGLSCQRTSTGYICKLPGLVNRREAERSRCLKGL